MRKRILKINKWSTVDSNHDALHQRIRLVSCHYLSVIIRSLGYIRRGRELGKGETIYKYLIVVISSLEKLNEERGGRTEAAERL